MSGHIVKTATLVIGALFSAFISWIMLKGVVTSGLATGKLFSDFQVMLMAADLAQQGRIADAYDPAVMLQMQQAASPGLTRVIYYNYPPAFALLLRPFLYLDRAIAQVIWTCLGLGLFITAIHACWMKGKEESQSGHRPTHHWIALVLLALATYPVASNLAGGQNGILLAGLAGLGFTTARTRPMIAGLCFALMTLKPQFCIVIPIAIIFGSLWKAGAWATGFTAVLTAFSVIVYGPDAFQAFLDSLLSSQKRLSDGGFTTMRMSTIFAALYDLLAGWSGAKQLAMTAQITATAATCAAIGYAWKKRDTATAIAVTLAGIPLTTPYFFDYDLVIFALPLAVVLGMKGLSETVRSNTAASLGMVLMFAPWGLLVYIITGERMNSAIALHPLSYASAALSISLFASLMVGKGNVSNNKNRVNDILSPV